MSDEEEKTEDATPERRRKAREDGQFPRARDTGSIAASIGVGMALAAMGGQFWEILSTFTRRCFSDGLTQKGAGIDFIGRELVGLVVMATLPLGVVAAIFGILAGIAEAGFHPNFDLVGPKFERLDPVSKLGQLFSPKAAASNVALSLLRVAAVAAVTYWILKSEFGDLAKLSRAPLGVAVEEVLKVLVRLSLWATGALVVLTGVDYVSSWFRHENQIKMSLQEIKDEYKQQEGSPQIKQRQRARARELLKRGIRQGVKEATVVVANPTHVAVALRYKANEGAPIVMAKGYDEIAQHIKELARDYDVPIVENRALARALASRAKVGKVIPVEYFVAVAEVLAFVFRLKKRGLRA